VSPSMKIRREIKRVFRQLRGLFSTKENHAPVVPQTSLDLDLRLDYVVRELVRLQMQMEQLHQIVLDSIDDRAAAPPTGFRRLK